MSETSDTDTGLGRPPAARWTEERLRALAPDEHDYQEFKGSGFLEDETGTPRSGFSADLSKQLSAFANGAGGRLFIGIDDAGRPDGGVLRRLKGGTREWLEDVIPGSVRPALARFNVFEVRSDGGPASRIGSGRAVYVVDIPTSADAPHQAADYRYYLRIAGKSRPMGHVHVLDVLHRRQHPAVVISRVDPYGQPDAAGEDPRGPRVLVRLRAHVQNRGSVLAKHVGVEFALPRWAVIRDTRRLMSARDQAVVTQHPGEIVFFYYHPIPLFPTQEVFFADLWVAVHRTNLERFRRMEVPVRWRSYADDAPVREGEFELARFATVQRAVEALAASLG